MDAIAEELGTGTGADHVVVVRRRPETRNLEAILSSPRAGAPASRTYLPLSVLEDPAEDAALSGPRDRGVTRASPDRGADRAGPERRPAAGAAGHRRRPPGWRGARTASRSTRTGAGWRSRRPHGPAAPAGACHAVARGGGPAHRRPDRRSRRRRLRPAEPRRGPAPRGRQGGGRGRAVAPDRVLAGQLAPHPGGGRRRGLRRARPRVLRCATPRPGRPRTRSRACPTAATSTSTSACSPAAAGPRTASACS